MLGMNQKELFGIIGEQLARIIELEQYLAMADDAFAKEVPKDAVPHVKP